MILDRDKHTCFACRSLFCTGLSNRISPSGCSFVASRHRDTCKVRRNLIRWPPSRQIPRNSHQFGLLNLSNCTQYRLSPTHPIRNASSRVNWTTPTARGFPSAHLIGMLASDDVPSVKVSIYSFLSFNIYEPSNQLHSFSTI